MALFKSDSKPGVPNPAAPATTFTPPAPMPSAPVSDVESVIGPNVSIRGDLNFEGSMRIEGKIEGKIQAQGRLTVARGAQILGEVEAAEAVIEGVVNGNVNASERVEVASTGQVLGDIHTARFVVGEGAKLLGNHDIDSEGIAKLSATAPGAKAAATHHRPAAASASKEDPLAKAF